MGGIIKDDLSGRRFGRLTVLRRGEDKHFPKGGKEVRWWCQCDCGSEPKLIYGKYLKNGRTSSCGCYTSELTSERNKILKKKYNQYDLSGEYGIGYTSKGEEFYFDLEDYDKIKEYCWCICRGYVIDRNHIKMHRVVMGLTKDDKSVVDHIGGKETKNDNRKCNLRVATYSQNGMNVGLVANNTSGVTGVYWHSRDEIWQARITVNGIQKHLGYYEKFEDAVKVRKEAEEKYFGEYSYDNSQKLSIKLKEGVRDDGQKNRDDVPA